MLNLNTFAEPIIVKIFLYIRITNEYKSSKFYFILFLISNIFKCLDMERSRLVPRYGTKWLLSMWFIWIILI